MRSVRPFSNPSTSDEAPFERVKRVLIVDDYKDAAETLCVLLNSLGYDACFFDKPLMAIADLERFAPDVCISDINMPEMNGYQFAQAVRTNPNFKATLLIALTSYTWPEHRSASFKAGFDKHLSKTDDIECLTKLLGAPRFVTDKA